MASKNVAAILAKDFVLLKIDQDRMLGADEIKKRFPKSEKAGIPWFVFLDPEGKELADSTGPEGNIGCPFAEKEIAHFVAMLEKARVQITGEDLETLSKSLVAERQKLEKKQ